MAGSGSSVAVGTIAGAITCGAGGIGGTLFSAFQRFDYDFVMTILLAIIAIIMPMPRGIISAPAETTG